MEIQLGLCLKKEMKVQTDHGGKSSCTRGAKIKLQRILTNFTRQKYCAVDFKRHLLLVLG